MAQLTDEAEYFPCYPRGQYAIFFALPGTQSRKTLKFNEILFIEVENVKMNDEEHCESEFYYPEVENERYNYILNGFLSV
jgi:hypothetical protein